MRIFISMANGKNPEVKRGDRIMCVKMAEETSVSMGDMGTVLDVINDPIFDGQIMVRMKWDNGSTLSLLSDADIWKKVKKENIDESKTDRLFDTFERHELVFEVFDVHYFNDFLKKIRDSGIINMFAASPLIYAGSEWIERYYGEGREDDEAFQEVINKADEAKDKFISSLLNYMLEQGMSIDDMEKVNSMAKRAANALLSIYISYH